MTNRCLVGELQVSFCQSCISFLEQRFIFLESLGGFFGRQPAGCTGCNNLLSGIVLLALPPALFAAVFQMNPDYLMLLFTDDLGKKMLVGGVVMQLLGAIVIRKIINIRV